MAENKLIVITCKTEEEAATLFDSLVDSEMLANEEMKLAYNDGFGRIVQVDKK
jgi:hypothetical protein